MSKKQKRKDERVRLFMEEVKPLLPFQIHSPTSREAAVSMQDHAPILREQVFKVINDEPEGLTDEEICLILNKKGDTVRPRRIELVNDDRIHASGKRHTRSGRFAVVWVAN